MTALKSFFCHQERIYTGICMLFLYSFFFWPLLNSISIILLTLYWLFFTKKSFKPGRKAANLTLLFLLPFLIYLAGMLYTENTRNGWAIVQLELPLLLFPLVFGTSSHMLTEGFVRNIKKHFVYACVLACLVSILTGLANFFQTGNPDALTYQQLNILPHSFPYTTAISCLLCIIFLTDKTVAPLLKRTYSIPVIVFLSIFILLLTLRLVIMLLLLLTLFLIIRSLPKTIHRLGAIVLMGISVSIAIHTIPVLNRKWQELTTRDNNAIRLDEDMSLGKNWGGQSIRRAIWACSADVIRQHPVTGVGTGDVQDELQTAYEARKFYFASRYNRYNAHNQYLQFALGQGFTGLAVFLACLIVPCLLFARNTHFYSYGAFLCIMAGICLTESALEVNKGVVWYSFFNAIFAFALLRKSSS